MSPSQFSESPDGLSFAVLRSVLQSLVFTTTRNPIKALESDRSYQEVKEAGRRVGNGRHDYFRLTSLTAGGT